MFAGSGGPSVIVLGDDCNPAQFEPFVVPRECTVQLTALIAGTEISMTLCGRTGKDIAEMQANAALPGYYYYRFNSDLARTERGFVAASYMRAHGVVDDSIGAKKRALCSWLYAIEYATRSTSPIIAETGSVTLTVLPGYSIHLTRPKSPEAGCGAHVQITSAALAAPFTRSLPAPTLREVLLALCEAARRPATEDPLDMLKEFDLDGLSYELNERDKAPVWINKKDHSPIADADLLSRGGNPLKQRSLFAGACDPCLACGLPIYSWFKRSCDVRSANGTCLLPSVKVCYKCSTQFYTYQCTVCGDEATFDRTALVQKHACIEGKQGSSATVKRIAGPAPLRNHRMWGSLELVQDKASHALVPAHAPALPRYMYCGGDRATPWQRLEYISRWAHSIIGRHKHRASVSLVGPTGHIDNLADHIIQMILAHIRDSIHPPSHRWITPLLSS